MQPTKAYKAHTTARLRCLLGICDTLTLRRQCLAEVVNIVQDAIVLSRDFRKRVIIIIHVTKRKPEYRVRQ